MPSPTTNDLLGEPLVGRESLPLQARTLALEEAPRPALALVVPELAEGLLEKVRRVQPLVRCQQDLQALAALAGEARSRLYIYGILVASAHPHSIREAAWLLDFRPIRSFVMPPELPPPVMSAQ